MGRRILIIDGHPDARAERFVHALAQAYRAGAARAQWQGKMRSLGAKAQ